MLPLRAIAAAGLAALVIGSAGPTPAAVRASSTCAAIAFRPVPSGSQDGPQDAGLYSSHFGRIAVRADVRGGTAQNYFVELNGNRPQTIASALPKSVEACAKAKRLSPPEKPEQPCLGDRFTVMIDHLDDRRILLLYAHRGGKWRFCSAGSV